MACSSNGSNLALAIVGSVVNTFENGVVPMLESAGKLAPASASAITTYVDSAVSVVNQVEADIKGNVGTPAKIAAVLQTAVSAYDSVANVIPGGTALALMVNVANLGIQSLLGVLGAESVAQAHATTPAPVASAPHTLEAHKIVALVTDKEPIHPGFWGNRKLDSAKSSMLKVQEKVHQLAAHHL